MIKIENLFKKYGNILALNNINISIDKGEIVGLLGLNGAGKSTAMNILAGCLAPSSGKVLIDGIDISCDPIEAKKKIGYLPEIPPLYMDMKVKDYLYFIHGLKKLKCNRKEEVNRVCEKLGIIDKKERLIRNLSKGYRQRVGFAQALIGDPPILILDEPTVGLDPTQIIEIRKLIKEIGKEHTVIISSHILYEIQTICQRVIVIDHGNIVADNTPDKLEEATRQKNICHAIIEGNVDKTRKVLQSIDSIESIKVLEQIEENICKYEIQGIKDRFILKPIFLALAKENLILLDAHSKELSLEDIFVKIISHEMKGENNDVSNI